MPLASMSFKACLRLCNRERVSVMAFLHTIYWTNQNDAPMMLSMMLSMMLPMMLSMMLSILPLQKRGGALTVYGLYREPLSYTC